LHPVVCDIANVGSIPLIGSLVVSTLFAKNLILSLDHLFAIPSGELKFTSLTSLIGIFV